MKKKFFKSKIEMILSIIIFILLLVGFIYFGNKDYNVLDNEVVEENDIIFNDKDIFVNINASDALNFVKAKNVIILFGVKSDFVKTYGNIVGSVAKLHGIEEIYYYDIESDREENNASYRSVVDYLSGYATMLDDGILEIFAPTLLIKKDNNIIYYGDDNALIKGYYSASEYFDEYMINSVTNKIDYIFSDYMGEIDG